MTHAALLAGALLLSAQEAPSLPVDGCVSHEGLNPERRSHVLPPADGRARVLFLWEDGQDLSIGAFDHDGRALAESSLVFQFRGPNVVALDPAANAASAVIRVENDSNAGRHRLCLRSFDTADPLAMEAWGAWRLLTLAQAKAPGEDPEAVRGRIGLAGQAAELFDRLDQPWNAAWAAYVQAYLRYGWLYDWAGAAEAAAAVAARFAALGDVDMAASARGLEAAALLEKAQEDSPAATVARRRQAIASLIELRALQLERGALLEAAWSANNLGLIHWYLEDHESAGSWYRTAISEGQALGARRFVDIAFGNYAVLGYENDPDRTVALLREIDPASLPDDKRSSLHYQLASALIAAADWPGALLELNRALHHAGQLADLVRARNALATLYLGLGQPARAATYVQQNLEDDVPGEVGAHAQTLALAARIANGRGASDEATGHLQQSIELASRPSEALLRRIELARSRQRVGHVGPDFEGLWAEAQALESAPGQARVAALAIEASDASAAWAGRGEQLLASGVPLGEETELVLALAARDRSMGVPASALARLVPLFDRHLVAARALSLDAVAVRLSDLQARYFRELAELQLELALAETDPVDRSRLADRALRRHFRIADLQRRLAPGAQGVDELAAEGGRRLAGAGSDEETLEAARREVELRVAAGASPDAGPGAVGLPDRVTAYLAGERHVYRVLRRAGVTTVDRIGTVAEVEGSIASLAGALRRPNGRIDRETLRRLGELLQLADFDAGERVAVVLDGLLGDVPLSLLRPDVSFARAVPTFQARQRASRTPGRPLLVGEPRVPAELAGPAGQAFDSLPGSGRELREVARVLGEREPLLLLGADATAERFLAELPTAGLVHVATHAFANRSVPQLSGLLFSSTGSGTADERIYLSLLEVMTLELGAEVVVLSACETGAGPTGAIGGAETLGAGFLAAGARIALVNQWEAPDGATVALMTRFHEQLRDGRDPAVALQAAQAHVRSLRPEWRHPYYWSGWNVLERLELEAPAG